MVEVLVALLLFSIAALGSVGAQLRARQQSLEAEHYAMASHLAADLLERMSSNPRQAAALTGRNLGAVEPPATADCRARTCTPAELARWDRREWLLMLRGTAQSVAEGAAAPGDGLPGARACVALEGYGATVSISWRGMTPAVAATAPACGAGEGLYGDGERLARSVTLRRFLGGAP
jgi:type IV pilus modification protein PilV